MDLRVLRRKKRVRVRRRTHQWERFQATGNPKHLKWFKLHRRAVRKLRRLIEQALREAEFASKNFRFSEFNCHEGDPVPAYMYPHLTDLCERILEPMRARFGACHVNSGHRWSWYNAAIGGASLSYHVYEDRKEQPAADLTFATGSPAEWAAYARELSEGGVGQYSSFVHVDTGPRRDWWG